MEGIDYVNDKYLTPEDLEDLEAIKDVLRGNIIVNRITQEKVTNYRIGRLLKHYEKYTLPKCRETDVSN
jgi:hypothetical protein